MSDEKKEKATVSAAKKRFFVSDGFEVTSKRGQLKSGIEVKPKDFADGAVTLNTFLKIGAVVEK